MQKIRLEIHPSVLWLILGCIAAILFLFSIGEGEKYEYIEVRQEEEKMIIEEEKDPFWEDLDMEPINNN